MTSIDLTAAFDKLQAQLSHNRECPNGECLDRDDLYGSEGPEHDSEHGDSADEW